MSRLQRSLGLVMVVIFAVSAASLAARPAFSYPGGTVAPLSVKPQATYAPTNHPSVPIAYRGAIAPKGTVTVSALPQSAPPSSAASPSGFAPGSSVVTIQSGFDGINFRTSGGYTPPDVQVAAGPNYIVEMVNLLETVYSKSGSAVQTVDLPSFFIAVGDDLTDPRVYYDQTNGRWVASISDSTTNEVDVAVSETSDPTGTWYVYAFTSQASAGYFADQPSLGVSSDKIVVAANMFDLNNNFVGTEVWVLNSSEMYTGTDTDYSDIGPDPTYFSIYPATNEGLSPDVYMVSVDPGVSGSFTLFTVTGTPPGDVSYLNVTLPIGDFNVPNGSIQRGSGLLIDSGDGRVVSAVRYGPNLWFAFSDAAIPSGDTRFQDGFRLVQVNLTSSTVRQDFDVNAAGTSYFYPALALDGSGNLVLLFGFSSASDYPGLMLSSQKASDPLGSIQTPSLVLAGAGPETRLPSGGIVRYGDYFGAAIDPVNSSVVWLAGQYGRSGTQGWGTHIISASLVSQTLTITAVFTVAGGGTGFSAPTLKYVAGSAPKSSPLTSSPQSFTVDLGSAWSVDGQLPGSNSTERWITAGVTSGIVQSSQSVTLTYEHEFNVTYMAVVGAGPVGYGTPTVSFSLLSSPVTVTLQPNPFASSGQGFSSSAWSAAGSSYSFPGTLPNSNGTLRWNTPTPTGTVTGSSFVTVRYFPQSAYVVSLASPSLPAAVQSSFTGVQAGSATTVPVTAQASSVWLDYGSAWSVNSSAAVDAGTRLAYTGLTTGTVGPASSIVLTFDLQYLLTIVGGPTTAGLVSPITGWLDSGTTVNLSATANTGWQVAGWTGSGGGSYTGTGATASFQLSGPVTEVVNFEPGLTITAGQGGVVSYTSGQIQGTVEGGSAKTVFLPANSTVSLFAETSSFLNQFAGWSGASASSSTSTVISLSEPTAVQATFGTNVVVLGVVGLVGVIVVIGVVFALRRKGPTPAAA